MEAIDKARKSLASTEDKVEKSAEAEKTDPDVKAQEEATKSTDEAEKHVNQATISDDNEKVTKDVDDDDVEESADKAKKSEDKEETCKKCGKPLSKCVCNKDNKATKAVDEAEKSEDKPAVEKNTDAKTEEAKAKQHKELANVDDPKGHEEASKSIDTNAVIDALTKSVDTMAEMQKSYKELAEASMEIAKSFLAKQAPIEDQAEKSVEKHENDADIEKSVDKKCKTAKSDDDDGQEPDEDSDDEAKDDKEDKAKKSVEESADNADEAEKSVEEPAEEDQAEKSIPTGKAVATGSEEADTVDKSVDASKEDGVTKEALENVIAKSLLGFDGVQSGVNLERKQALKSLLADTRGLKGATVPNSFIERYNEI